MALRIPEFISGMRYQAQQFRYMFGGMAPLQSGVIGQPTFDPDTGTADSGGLRVTPTSPAPGMSLEVAAGEAWISNPFGARQGFYHVVNDDPVIVPVSANLSGLPRIDTLVLRVYDEFSGPDTDTLAALEVLPGLPTFGADYDNRLGIADLPDRAIRLAHFEVAANATAIDDSTGARLIERRPWAHGMSFARRGSVTGDSLPTSAITAPHMEISSGLIRIRYTCSLHSGVTETWVVEIKARIGGTGSGNFQQTRQFTMPTANGTYFPLSLEWIIPVTPHAAWNDNRYGVQLTTISGSGGVVVGNSAHLFIDELVKPESFSLTV